MGRVTEILKELKDLVGEAAPSTANALMLPTGITKDLAKRLVDELPLQVVLKDLAIVVAREVGNELMALALRPCDYVELDELPHVLVERLIDELAKKPAVFFDTFAEQLKLKG